MEESISRLAGSYHGVKLDPPELIAAAHAAGRPAAERTHALRDPRRAPAHRSGGVAAPPDREVAPTRQTVAAWDRGVRSSAVSTANSASPARETSLFAGVEPLEVFVDLLSEIESDTTSSEFYHRICEAICRLTTTCAARRSSSTTSGASTSGRSAPRDLLQRLAALRPTLDQAPIAQRALIDDRVIVVHSDALERELPRDYAALLDVALARLHPDVGRRARLGVIVADRGAGDSR